MSSAASVVALLDVLPEPALIVDRDDVVRHANPAAAELFGYELAALVGLDLAALVPPAHRAAHASRTRSFHAAPSRRVMAPEQWLSARRQDGVEIPVEIALAPVELDGRPHVFVAVRDASRARRRLRELERAEERARTAAQLARVGYFEVDLVRDRRNMSPEMLALLGRAAPHASMADFFAAIHPDDRTRLRAAIAGAAATGGYEIEMRMRHADGTWRWFHSKVHAELEGGAARALRGVAMDITEARAAADQLRLRDRLVALGLLSASIGHEIKNPLAVVVANLELLARGLAGRGDAADAAALLPPLAGAREAADRVRDIVNDLRVFTGPDDAAPEAIELRPVVDAAIRLARAELLPRARVTVRHGDVPRAIGHPGRLGQVLLNLLVNAAQAIEPGHPERHEVAVTTRRGGGDAVVIEVADTGVGIAPDRLETLFTPFVTTKGDAGGSGLGLAISREIVVALGGQLTCESQPGAGTTFRVALRAAPEDAAAAPAARGGAPRGRVLVVDDEPRIAEVVGELLGERHDVVVVGSARAALAALAEARFDAVVCDVAMPEMSGLVLHAQVGARDAAQAARFVFLSGGALSPRDRAHLADLAAGAPGRVIDKPFTADALLAAVDACVAAPPPRPA